MTTHRLALAVIVAVVLASAGTVATGAAPGAIPSVIAPSLHPVPSAPAAAASHSAGLANLPGAVQRAILSDPEIAPRAQMTGGPYPIVSTGYTEWNPAVAFDSKRDRYLVVWDREEADGSGAPRNIYGRFVGVNGETIGGTLSIAVDADTDEYTPAVAYNGAIDEFAVVFEYKFSTSDTDPYWKRVNAGTGAVVATYAVSSSTDLTGYPAVAADNLPGSMTRWYFAYRTDANSGTSNPSGTIQASIFGARGSQTGILGSPVALNDEGYDINAYWPQITFAPSTNRFLVAFEDYDSSDYDILVRSVNATTGALGSINYMTSCGSCDEGWTASISFNQATSTALVTWVDYRNSGATEYRSIFGRIVDGNGATVSSSEFQIWNGTSSYPNSYPSASPDVTGGWTVLWSRPSSTTATNTDLDVVGRWIGPSAALGPFFYVTTDQGTAPTYDDDRVKILINPYFGSHFAVHQHYYGAGDEDVYGSLITGAKFPLVIAKADFDGDHHTDRVVVRMNSNNTMTWFVVKSSGGAVATTWGAVGDVPVPGDYDGDGKTDVAVWRPSDGGWYFVGSAGVSWAYAFGDGASGDIPVPADYDGDGKTDMAVFRPGATGAYYIISSASHLGYAVSWGTWGDVPVTGDFDGDGKTDIAVWRPSNGTFYIIPSNGTPGYSRTFGAAGDQPIVADFDGDGKTDAAVFRPYDTGGVASWYYIKSSNGAAVGLAWGALGDIPLPADYDGDGKTDVAVWRPGNPGGFYIVQSSNNQSTGLWWGQAFDIPVAK